MALGKLIIISGPSGVGKKTILDQIMQDKSLNLHMSISMTTRQPRNNEQDGKDYFFTTVNNFKDLITKNNFLEYAVYNNNYYGTPKSFVRDQLACGNNVLLEIETVGVKKLSTFDLPMTKIFIAPPSIDTLRERLIKRNTESMEVINQRLLKAQEELKLVGMYDYIVINEELNSCIEQIRTLIKQIINHD